MSLSILNLREQAQRLAPNDAARFRRIYDVTESEGHLRVPSTMAPWVEHTFGSVEAVKTQRIVRISNLVTGESAIFNELRARRPMRGGTAPDIQDELANDPWAEPEENTPEDLFGRLRNDTALTAANVAKYDAHHSLLVFSEANPLRFDRASVRDCVALANRCSSSARADHDASSVLLWNCLWRAALHRARARAGAAGTRTPLRPHRGAPPRLLLLSCGARRQLLRRSRHPAHRARPRVAAGKRSDADEPYAHEGEGDVHPRVRVR